MGQMRGENRFFVAAFKNCAESIILFVADFFLVGTHDIVIYYIRILYIRIPFLRLNNSTVQIR